MNSLPSFNISLNDISTVEFSMPSHIFNSDTNSYIPTPLYADVVAKKLLLIEPFGYWRITECTTENDGIAETKNISASSLEVELNDVDISAWEGTFPLYNLANPTDTNTILGMVHALKPSWSIGHISATVMDYWRTFSISEKTVYSFLKEDIQKAYQCVFVFDTTSRIINVYTISELANTSIISLSYDNLIKSVEAEYLGNDTVTRLEVFGAGDVDIREINPRGDNYLYNYDYYMNASWLPEETGTNGLIAKWQAYKTLWNSKQKEYDDLMILWRIYSSNLLNAQVKLRLLEDEWNGLKTRQKDYANYASDSALKTLYDNIQKQLKALEPQINSQKQIVAQAEYDNENIVELIRDVNNELKFSAFFTPAQLNILDTITFVDKLVCESFVVYDTNFAGEPITSSIVNSGTLVVTGSDIKQATNSITNMRTYLFTGSDVSYTYEAQILNDQNTLVNTACTMNLKISDGTVALLSSNSFVGTFNVNTGTIKIGGTTYPITNGLVTLNAQTTGTPTFTQNSRFSISHRAGNIYATEANTSLGRQKVIRELYTYANDIFSKIAVPSFQFDVDSINLFFKSEFKPVLTDFKMGNTVSVMVEEDRWLKPMLLGVEIDFNDETYLRLQFSNKLRFGTNEFEFTDLFEEAITGGRDSTANKFDYLEFTGSNANNILSSYISNSLDASKQMLMSAENQEVTFGGYGLLLRKARGDGTFYPNQLWATNNQIALTKDSWDSVSLAIGEINFNNNIIFGISADLLAGRKILGNSLELMATSTNGTNVSGFTFNGNGAIFNNARTTWTNPDGYQFVVDPVNEIFAFGSGIYSIDSQSNYTPRFNPPSDIGDSNDWWDDPRIQGIKLFADNQGDLYLRGDIYSANAYIRGRVEATSGYFSGELRAATGVFDGEVYARDLILNGRSILDSQKENIMGEFLDLEGLRVNNGGLNSMEVNGGVIRFGTGTNSITIANGRVQLGSGVKLDWGSLPGDVASIGDIPPPTSLPNYIKNTYIDSVEIRSPDIKANLFTVEPTSSRYDNGFLLKGIYNSRVWNAMKIETANQHVVFYSPDDFYATWGFGNSSFSGHISFASANSIDWGNNAPPARFG